MRTRLAAPTTLAAVVLLAGACGSADGGASGTGPGAERVPLCEDVPLLTSSVIGNGSTAGPGPALLDAVNRYAAQHEDVWVGGWIDHDAGGTYVIGVTDDPEPHRAAIVELAPPAGWSVPWDVLQVERSRQDIIDDTADVWETLQAGGIDIAASYNDFRRNRLNITLGEPTEAKLIRIAELVDPDDVCVEGPLVDPDRPQPQPGDELAVIPPSGDLDADTLVSCTGGDSFPLNRILDPEPVSARPDVETGLQNYLTTTPTVPKSGRDDGWFIVTADDDAVSLLSVGGSLIGLKRSQIGWRFAHSGGCGLRVALPDGLGAVDWRLDPARPQPTPTSTEIELLVEEAACANGQPMGERLLGPQVVETDTEVLIAFAAISQPGAATCPANPEQSVVVTLTAPLGTRTLRNGGRVDLDLGALLPS